MNANKGTGAIRRVSVGEIAEMAGVRPSAVSNWRSRHDDFPLPVEQSAGGDLFDLNSVIAWLQAKGKQYQRPRREWDRVLWKELDAIRGGGMALEQAVLLMLQLLYLRDVARRGGKRDQARTLAMLERVRADPRHAGEVWTEYVREVSQSNADLARALDLPHRLKGEQLVRVLQIVNHVVHEDGDLGELATALIQRYQEALGIRGVASTPRSLTDLQVALLEPIRGSVYDPAAGAAMVLADAWRRRVDDGVLLIGQDINEYTWRLGYLHLSLLGANFKLETGDTLRDDSFRSFPADRIAADPPFGSKPNPGDLFMDERWVFGVPRAATDWLWAQHLIFHLSEEGVGVMTSTLGALSRSGAEESVRAGILEADLLDAVIELAPGLLAGTSIPVALLVFAKNRGNRNGRVLFINANQLGQARRGKLHELESADIDRIVSAVRSWRDGNWKEEPRFAAAASTEEILANRTDLSPKRYVRFSTRVTEIDGEPIRERLQRLRLLQLATVATLEHAVGGMTDGIDVLSGPSSEDWPLVRLGELLTSGPRTGTRPDADGEGDPIPYIQTGVVSGGAGRLESMPDEVTYGNVRDRVVSRGDLLLTSRGISAEGRIGCATVAFHGAAAYSESLLRLSPDPEKVDPDYLRLFLTSRQGRKALFAATTGSVISNLRPDAVTEIEIRLPDLTTQQRIGAALRQIEEGVAGLRAALDTSEDIIDTIREGIAGGILGPISRQAPSE